MTALRIRLAPHPPVWRGHELAVGDVCTATLPCYGPVSLTVRTWGRTRTGDPWVAGNRRSALVADILVVERDGVRLT